MFLVLIYNAVNIVILFGTLFPVHCVSSDIEINFLMRKSFLILITEFRVYHSKLKQFELINISDSISYYAN